MPRTCTLCNHKERDAIDLVLLEGQPYRRIATQFNVSEAAVRRHRDHLPGTLIRAHEAAEVAHADNLLEQVRALQTRALSILDRADAAGDLRTALSAIREARGNLELLAKLLGELQQEGTVNITLSPEWISLRAKLVTALLPYPEVAQAVAGALRESD